MNAVAHSRIVLAVADPGLRSALVAQLGLAGELVIATTDHLDGQLSPAIRATSLLVIEQSLISSVGPDWAETLRAQNWLATVIVIVDPVHGLKVVDEHIHLADREVAGVQILALLQLLRARRV
jgi:hypothetical protein